MRRVLLRFSKKSILIENKHINPVHNSVGNGSHSFKSIFPLGINQITKILPLSELLAQINSFHSQHFNKNTLNFQFNLKKNIKFYSQTRTKHIEKENKVKGAFNILNKEILEQKRKN